MAVIHLRVEDFQEVEGVGSSQDSVAVAALRPTANVDVVGLEVDSEDVDEGRLLRLSLRKLACQVPSRQSSLGLLQSSPLLGVPEFNSMLDTGSVFSTTSDVC